MSLKVQKSTIAARLFFTANRKSAGDAVRANGNLSDEKLLASLSEIAPEVDGIRIERFVNTAYLEGAEKKTTESPPIMRSQEYRVVHDIEAAMMLANIYTREITPHRNLRKKLRIFADRKKTAI